METPTKRTAKAAARLKGRVAASLGLLIALIWFVSDGAVDRSPSTWISAPPTASTHMALSSPRREVQLSPQLPSVGISKFSLATLFGSHAPDVFKNVTLRPLDLQGWGVHEVLYRKLVDHVKAQLIVEVGVWKGASSVFFAKLLAAQGHGVVLSVDTWLGSLEHWLEGMNNPKDYGLLWEHGHPTLYTTFQSNVVHQNVADYVIPFPATSRVAAQLLAKKGVQADLIHIDAGHEYTDVMQDLQLWWPLLRPGGVLIGDDYSTSWPGVMKAAQEFASAQGLQLQVDSPKFWFQRHETGPSAMHSNPLPEIAEQPPSNMPRRATTTPCPMGTGGPSCEFSLATLFGSHAPDVFKNVTLRPLDLQGWGVHEVLYRKLVDHVKAQLIVEVGVWKGASSVFFAKLLAAQGHGVVLSVDTWLGSLEHWLEGMNNPKDYGLLWEHGHPTLYTTFQSNVVHQNVADYVIPFPATSRVAAQLLAKKGVQADLIHIDAGHEYTDVMQDLQLWWPLLRPGGVLIGDDYSTSWPGVMKAAQEFASAQGLQLQVDSPKFWLQKRV